MGALTTLDSLTQRDAAETGAGAGARAVDVTTPTHGPNLSAPGGAMLPVPVASGSVVALLARLAALSSSKPKDALVKAGGLEALKVGVACPTCVRLTPSVSL